MLAIFGLTLAVADRFEVGDKAIPAVGKRQLMINSLLPRMKAVGKKAVSDLATKLVDMLGAANQVPPVVGEIADHMDPDKRKN